MIHNTSLTIKHSLSVLATTITFREIFAWFGHIWSIMYILHDFACYANWSKKTIAHRFLQIIFTTLGKFSLIFNSIPRNCGPFPALESQKAPLCPVIKLESGGFQSIMAASLLRGVSIVPYGYAGGLFPREVPKCNILYDGSMVLRLLVSWHWYLTACYHDHCPTANQRTPILNLCSPSWSCRPLHR